MAAVVAPFVVKILLTKIAFGITVGTLVNIATVYAVSQMLTKAARRKANGQGSGTGSDLVMSREPAPVRRIVYGETRVSGPMAFANISGDKNSTLCVAVLLAAHECEAIGAYLVDDEQVTPDGAGNVMTGTYAVKLALSSHLGDQTTADAMLVSSTCGVWNPSHVLRGITYLAAKLTYDTDVYSGGLPNLSVILRGKRVYDPRTGLTAWSQNPALIVRDYLTNADYGLGCTADEIDDALIIAASNICDEDVALKAGGTEARYRCNGTFTTDAEPATIIETILSTMAGSITYSGGKFRVYAGAYSAPSVTLDESDMAGAIEFQPTTGIREACNIVKGSFTSPADLYQPRDFPRFADASHITADGEEIPTDLDLAWVSSPSQAQRLAKIYERKARLGGTVSLKCKLSAFRCQTGETIAVSNTRLGWSDKVFQVQEWRFAIGNDGALGVDLTCRETSSSVYDWYASEEGILTTTSQSSNPPTTMQNVTGAVADGTPGTYQDLNGGTGGGTPVGGVVVQSRGGAWTEVGYASFDGTEPSRRWLTKTASGTITYEGRAEGMCSLCQTTHTVSGAAHYDPATGLCSSSIKWVMLPTSGGCLSGETGTGSHPCEYDPRSGIWNNILLKSVTATVSRAYGDGSMLTTCAWISGENVATLINEDTPRTAIDRMLVTAEWSEVATAIRTVPTTGITGVYRELRYRTQHTEGTGEAAVTYPTLTGLAPWWRYRVTVHLERRPVDELGSPTGDGSWSAAGERVHYLLADIDGEGGIDWQTVEPTAGYETRIASSTVEVA